MEVQPKQSKRVYEFGPFTIDRMEGQLLRDGRPILLTPKAFELLTMLVENHGHVVSKDELMDRVWAGSIVEESNLKVTISMLRKALAEEGNEQIYIETIPKRGYRFIAPVHETSGAGRNLIVHELTKSRITIEHDEEVSDEATAHAVAAWSLTEKFNLQKPAAWLILALGAVAMVAVALSLSRLFEPHRSPLFQIDKVTQLTAIGRVANVAALSPDGKLFAYSVKEGEMESLWLGHVDGGDPVRIFAPIKGIYVSLSFAPDGSSLYYTLREDLLPGVHANSMTGLYRIPVFGGAPEKLSDHVVNHVAFSPDGKRFAYVRNGQKESPWALMIADTEGAQEREIAWPSGKNRFAMHSAAWSPDGKRIAFAASVNDNNSTYEVFTVTVADGAMKPLTAYGWNRVQAVMWQHDGDGLIVTASDKHSVLFQLWHISYPKGEVQRIVTDLSGYDYSTSLSTDNRSLLTVQVNNHSDIWVAPADNLSHARQITFSSTGRQNGWRTLNWAPDGRIVYTAREGEGWTIWVMKADGSDSRRLIPPGGQNVAPSLTDDGRYLVFQSDRGGKAAIWRVGLDGSDLKQLTNTDNAIQPDVSPDGRWIVYVSSNEDLGELYRIPIDGGEPLRLTDKRVCFPQISPDSRQIACAYEDEGRVKLAILPIDGGTPLKLFEVPRLANLRSVLRWTADGQAVAYRDWGDGIWRQNIKGGAPERLMGLPQEKLYGYGWSRDGKWFAFTRGAEARDVVLLNLSYQHEN